MEAKKIDRWMVKCTLLAFTLAVLGTIYSP